MWEPKPVQITVVSEIDSNTSGVRLIFANMAL